MKRGAGCGWLTTLGVMMLSASARGDEVETTRACIDAHVAVQEQRLAGDLLGAAGSARTCAAAGCPSLPRAECARWAEDIARDLPAVAVTVVGSSPGAQLGLTVDGEPRPLDGSAILLNPGHHSFEVTSDGRVVRRSVHLVRGQREALAIDVAQSVPTDGTGPVVEPQPRQAWVPVGPIVLGALGVVGLGVFSVAAGLGAAEYGELEASCAPGCSAGETSSVDSKLLTADVALAVGSATLLAGGIWLVIELATRGDARPAATTPLARGGARGLTISF